MLFKCRDKECDGSPMKKREAGFSLVELMIVCVIMLIIAALAIPNIFQTYRNYQLDSAGHSVASLLQQARMQAVKTNQPVYVKYDNTAVPNLVYATDAPGTAYAGASHGQFSCAAGCLYRRTTPGGYNHRDDRVQCTGAALRCRREPSGLQSSGGNKRI